MTRRGPLLVMVLLLTAFPAAALLSGRGQGDGAENAGGGDWLDFSSEARRVAAWTLVPDAAVRWLDVQERRGWTDRVEWELQIPHEWTVYRGVLERSMPSGYTVRERGGESFSVIQSLPGDVIYVEIKPLPGNAPRRVRVEFMAMPS